MKKLLSLAFLFLFLLTNCSSKNNTVKIKIKENIYTFELAVTSEERKTGLMYRKNLDKNGGMLFVYPKEYGLSFYMKNTLIPLDIAFINSNLTIIDIKSMQPLDETPIDSKSNAQYALEVNEGFFKNIGVKEGDKIELITPIPYIIE